MTCQAPIAACTPNFDFPTIIKHFWRKLRNCRQHLILAVIECCGETVGEIAGNARVGPYLGWRCCVSAFTIWPRLAGPNCVLTWKKNEK